MPREPNRAYLLAVLLLLVGLRKAGCSTSAPRYPVCKPGFEFWSVERATCWPCTRCAPEFTLSPCAIYKDAICGPLSALELDWSFLSTRKRPETGQRSLEAVTSKMLWRFPDLDQQQIRQESKDFADNSQQDIQSKTKNQVLNESPYPRSAATSKERILWDWQTVALILAVCACILFFLVAGCSALVYARQWRRMKKNFEPVGLEEISARLNLMVKAELAELVAGAPMNPGDPETRCQYLEKLLDRKRETPVVSDWPEVSGNVYIEDGDPSKKLQIARIHRNIETMLNQKKSFSDS
ncbi:tumor necrosis factor receptor superfamily member wengen [Bombus vancouverensis nearcticus]|uniref:Tumor necrosis factor receptor superfamily member wengen n=1 Tax=Bombus bifarius TaxID=103933 RepID=A0A6P8NCA1_9HYME|nr:tumor necrosis factor receptor superfamily member wengen [Bombus vancouverensis nearcticus]XP_033312120.1 tumor necrosis factor receptor superfamily member wengen [Bombus bifarius]